jgi:hypothetical protein
MDVEQKEEENQVEENQEDQKQQDDGNEIWEEKEVETKNAVDQIEKDEEEEVVITVGDEESEPEYIQAPGWVKDVRIQNRELKRKLREIEAVQKTPKPDFVDDPGPEPTLADQDIDYDSDVYSAKFKTWHNKTQAKEKAVKEKADRDKKDQDSWNVTLSNYGHKKNNLKVKGFEESEALVQELLSEIQIGIILDGADDPAKVVYAIGKDSKRAKILAAITSPVKFAVAMAKLEVSLKTTKRKPAPAPSSLPKGSAISGGNHDKNLDKLYSEAAISGDMSKIRAYKNSMKK